MGLYLLKRAAQAGVVLVGVTLGSFLLMHLAPGDPVRVILGNRASAAAVAEVRGQLGLDRPLLTQYWQFLEHAATLTFGRSITQRVAVGGLIGPRLGVTLFLTLYATVVAVVVAVPLGVWSAVRRNRPADHGVRFFSMVTFAMPPFWFGLLLILVCSVELHLLPTSGYGSGVLGHVRGLTLPAITLGLGMAPIVLRTLRTSMSETLAREYVEAARARGLSGARVLWRYAFRNSLVSSITVLGVNVGYLLSTIVVVENVFALPGIGQLLVTSVQDRDFPTVQGLALVFAVLVLAINLATDLAYAAIDPRVRL